MEGDLERDLGRSLLTRTEEVRFKGGGVGDRLLLRDSWEGVGEDGRVECLEALMTSECRPPRGLWRGRCCRVVDSELTGEGDLGREERDEWSRCLPFTEAVRSGCRS